jgi:hypothetical protein
MDIFEEIKKLNFPVEKYVIVGGASMAARGIKETGDIDIIVAPDLFEKCKQEGWEFHAMPNGKPSLRRGVVELYLDINCGNFNPTRKYLLQNSEIINGVPFSSLKDIIKFKKEYNREKDSKDIKLIEEYLKLPM